MRRQKRAFYSIPRLIWVHIAIYRVRQKGFSWVAWTRPMPQPTNHATHEKPFSRTLYPHAILIFLFQTPLLTYPYPEVPWSSKYVRNKCWDDSSGVPNNCTWCSFCLGNKLEVLTNSQNFNGVVAGKFVSIWRDKRISCCLKSPKELNLADSLLVTHMPQGHVRA